MKGYKMSEKDLIKIFDMPEDKPQKKKKGENNRFRLNVKDADLIIVAIEHYIKTKNLTCDQVDSYRYIISKFQLTDAYLRKHVW